MERDTDPCDYMKNTPMYKHLKIPPPLELVAVGGYKVWVLYLLCTKSGR